MNDSNVSAITTPVNGGDAGLSERQEFFGYAYFILSDDINVQSISMLKRQLE